MRRQKKPFKFYLIIFIFSVVLVIGYSLYMIFFKDGQVSELYPLWFMPIIFTGFYYVSDTLMDKIANRKKKVSYESIFLGEVSKKMRESNEFIVEEYRRLQNSRTFQDDLKKAYFIYKDGENETYNIERLEKKYKKDSLEKKAMKHVIEYLKENKKIPESD